MASVFVQIRRCPTKNETEAWVRLFLKDKKIPGVRGTPALVATRLDYFVVVVVVLDASIGSSTIDSMNCSRRMAEQQDNRPYITRNNNNGQ